MAFRNTWWRTQPRDGKGRWAERGGGGAPSVPDIEARVNSSTRDAGGGMRHSSGAQDVDDPAPYVTPKGGEILRRKIEEFPAGTKVAARRWVKAMEDADYQGSVNHSYELMQKLVALGNNPQAQQARAMLSRTQGQFAKLTEEHAVAAILRKLVPEMRDITSAEVRELGITGRESKGQLAEDARRLTALRRRANTG
ncbi:hypothetical protein JNW90_10690 [Micromonospora sp. STR1s_5]|nr:hypothetical protein [Micromonospora sp. STR1s_5]